MTKAEKGHLGFLTELFQLEPETLNPDTVPGLPAFLEKCRQITPMALDTLQPRSREAIEKYYGLRCEARTFAKISEDLNLSPDRVRQIVEQGVRTLRGSNAFDQLALDLSAYGQTSFYLEIACARARSQPIIDAVKERVLSNLKPASLGEFLKDHKAGCDPSNPCPTCRATALLAAHGIEKAIAELLLEWHTDVAVDLLDIPIDFALPGLTIRTRNCLKNDGITTLRKLTKMTEAELLRTPNFGRKSLDEIKERLLPFGLTLEMCQ